jgi:7-cyano-7-deazaguanine synthase
MKPHAAAADPAGLAVLVSGGLDSAILLADSLRHHAAVQPLYVREGLCWEEAELAHLRRYLAAIERAGLRALHVLEMPVADLYGGHWSITGRAVPSATMAEDADFLPGRNVLFLAKAMLWCHLHRVPAVALGVLGTNPHPDATADFFAAFARVVNQAIGGDVEVQRPFVGLTKTEVMHRGRDLPLGLTFSCYQPAAGRPCGSCLKCAERRRAFAEAGMPDVTAYVQERPCSA